MLKIEDDFLAKAARAEQIIRHLLNWDVDCSTPAMMVHHPWDDILAKGTSAFAEDFMRDHPKAGLDLMRVRQALYVLMRHHKPIRRADDEPLFCPRCGEHL